MSCDLYAYTWNLAWKTRNAEPLTVGLYIGLFYSFLRKAATRAKYHTMIKVQAIPFSYCKTMQH